MESGLCKRPRNCLVGGSGALLWTLSSAGHDYREKVDMVRLSMYESMVKRDHRVNTDDIQTRVSFVIKFGMRMRE